MKWKEKFHTYAKEVIFTICNPVRYSTVLVRVIAYAVVMVIYNSLSNKGRRLLRYCFTDCWNTLYLLKGLFFQGKKKDRMTPEYALGLFYIFCVSVIWSLASILVQYMYHDLNFDSPFVVTYVGSSLFAVLLVLYVIPNPFCRRKRGQHVSLDEKEYASQMTHFKIACKIAPFWFLANYLYNASLNYTSITSSTVLSSTGSLFTYAFATFSGEEKCEFFKFAGVLIAIVGSIITGLKDASSEEDDHDDTIIGDAASLLSAVGYGIYTVMIRKYCKQPSPQPNNNNNNSNDAQEEEDEDANKEISIQLILGYNGLFNMLTLLPICAYCIVRINSTPIQTDDNSQINTPTQQHFTWFILGCLVVKGLSDNVLSDYLWARSIILTSATVASVGVGLTIPLAMISDLWMRKDPSQVFTLPSILGALFVLIGFVLVNLEYKSKKEHTNGNNHHSYEQVVASEPNEITLQKEISIPKFQQEP